MDRASQVRRQHRHHPAREVRAPRGTPDLVGDDPQGPALAGAGEDGADEVPPARPVHPGRPDDEVMVRGGVANGGLAVGLAPGVHALGAGRIVLDVRPGAGAVEDKVRAEVHEQRSRLGGGPGQDGRGLDVQAADGARVVLGPVHVGPGGQVDDGPRAEAVHRGGDGRGVGHVEVAQVREMDGRRVGRLGHEKRPKVITEEPGGAGHQDGSVLVGEGHGCFRALTRGGGCGSVGGVRLPACGGCHLGARASTEPRWPRSCDISGPSAA